MGHFFPNEPYQDIRRAWEGWSLFFVGPGVGSGINSIARYLQQRNAGSPIDELSVAAFDSRVDPSAHPWPVGHEQSYHSEFTSGDARLLLRMLSAEGQEWVYQFPAPVEKLLCSGLNLLQLPGRCAPLAEGTRESPVDLSVWAKWQGPRSAYVELDEQRRTVRYWQS